MENTKHKDMGFNYNGRVKKNRHGALEKTYTEKEVNNLDAGAKEIYSNLITISRKIISGIDSSYIDIYEDTNIQIAQCIDELKRNPFLLRYIKHSTADNYLYAHTANTTLLSLSIGLAMNLNEKDLSTLGISALLHDIGMTKFISLARKERNLTFAELNLIKKHSSLGIKKLNRIIDFNYGAKEQVENIISQIHERHDGSGYPENLKGDEINILAGIISVADFYEALTHIRAWRARMSCHDVIRKFIEEHPSDFNPLVIKKLIAVLSIFPPGSIIELSNGIIAQVLKINKGSLMRPMVKTILDENYKPIEEEIIDLAQYPLTSINDIITLDNLRKENPSFAAELELSLLWIEW
ncbi:MAG: HD domain-containing protein [Elusimicrobiota bacterium]|nr:HD domain-containing protein [Elusimicrobiota bacterium]